VNSQTRSLDAHRATRSASTSQHTMPSRSKSTKASKQSQRKDITENLSDPPTEINPYTVLGVAQTASATEIRTAYRKLALQWHPDKQGDKEQAHTKFQEIAFAYAILSDETRRKRYDATGSLEETEEGDFNWKEWFSEMWDGVVNGDTIKEFSEKYQGKILSVKRVNGRERGREGRCVAGL